jgi:hypothetical protein
MARVILLPEGPTTSEKVEPKNLGKRVKPATGTPVSDLTPPLGWARLAAEDNAGLSLLCELGDGYPKVTQGYGGFDTVARSQDVALTPWRGRRRTKTPDGGYVKPPAVIVHTAGVMPYDAHAYPDMRWAINALDWDDEQTITNDAGNRVRAPVTLTLLQLVQPARLQSAAMAALAQRQRNDRKSRGARRYTARKGDTAMSIARSQLGDAGRYVEILKLNGLRDPRAIREGAILKIPR